MIDRKAKFDSFATDLVKFLHMHRTEINGKLCKTVNKVSTKGTMEATPENQYRQVLTDYAFKLVETQIQKSREVTVTETWDQFSCTSGGQDYNASRTSCTCDFQKQYKLPCKHLFAIRLHKGEDLYSEELIESRWTKAKYFGILNQTATENQIQTAETTTSRKPTSQQERFRKSFRITQRLASVAAENTGASFDVKLNQLRSLLTAWENGHNVVINTVENSETRESLSRTENINGTNDIVINTDALTNMIESDQENSKTAQNTHDNGSNDSSDDSDADLSVAQSADEPENHEIPSPAFTENPDNNHSSDTMNETSDAANLLLMLANGTPRREPGNDDFIEDIQSEIPHAIPHNDENVLQEPTNAHENLRVEASIDIADIILPPKIQKRGRPKGSELTVIGLPKKRLKLQKSKCIAFERMNDTQKQSLVLSWIVEKRVVENACQRVTEYRKKK